jgi:hypothetical protein
VLARSLDQGLAGWLLGSGRPLVLAAAVVPAAIWVRRRPRRVYAAVGLVLLAPLALSPAWSPRDLVWPAVFAYLGDARWASIYAVAAGATVAWTSTWWGSGVPWHGGVDPATIPTGAVAGLGLVTWVVLGSWVSLGWRTVMVETGPVDNRGDRATRGTVDNRGNLATRGAVDNRGNLATRSATLPPGGLDAGPGHTGTPGHGSPTGNGSMAGSGAVPGNGSMPANGVDNANRPIPANEDASPSRGSLSLPK